MASPRIFLQDFRMCKTESAVVYSLQLCNGRESWLVIKRYSELQRIHVQLLERFNRNELPDFPPKEPLLQKMFGWGGARNDWMEERFVRLRGYLQGLLEHPGAIRTGLLTDLLEAPRKAPVSAMAAPEPPSAKPPSTKASSPIDLRDFRMCKNGSSVLYSLQLSDGGECWLVARRYSEFLRIHVQLLEQFNRSELPDFPPKEPLLQKMFGWGEVRDDWLEERFVRLRGYLQGLLEHPGAMRTGLLTDFLDAPRKALAPLAATATDLLSPVGTLQIRDVRVRLTRESGSVEVVVRSDAREPCSIRLALRPLPEDSEQWQDGSSADLNLRLPLDKSWERFLELDMDPSKSTEVRQRLDLEPGSLWQVAAAGVASDGATGDAVCIQLRAPTSQELENLPTAPASSEQSITSEMDDGNEQSDCVPASCPVVAEHQESHEAESRTELETSTRVARGQSCQLEVETKASPTSDIVGAASDSLVQSPKASGRSCSSMAEIPAKRPARKRRSLSSPSHIVISFKGSAAAQYAQRIEESQRLAAERVPHRWEAAQDGRGGCSMPVKKVSVKGASGYSGAVGTRRPSMEEVESHIQVQQQMRLREDEQLVSVWIHASTGDAGASEAASGKASLEPALASGEVLCDLINAIWPGRIVGIARNKAASKHFRRIANIAHFVEACRNAGVAASSLFVPSDLAEGKNFASVLRCIRALALLLPAAYEGPRLTGSCGAEASSTVNSLQDDRTS
eukprot:TRINITY_DN5027_c0_g3_i1.p1 TRINITY_DN5027_c0_g3~~TRINITY_DN5027_c0_g3_i1.p1  ORF type:complete len:758 (+),score=128.27 TRINITY_DN5027_c0_g3_i1:66-2276(+)